MPRLRIGDDRREAIDWIQDRLEVHRPAAEQVTLDLLKEGIAVTTDEGIFLVEDEEEVNRRISRSVGKFMAKASKGRLRNHNWHRTGRTRKGQVIQNGKVMKTTYSEAAHDMMQSELDRDDDGDE